MVTRTTKVTVIEIFRVGDLGQASIAAHPDLQERPSATEVLFQFEDAVSNISRHPLHGKTFYRKTSLMMAACMINNTNEDDVDSLVLAICISPPPVCMRRHDQYRLCDSFRP
jgi:hypothetical protein